VSFCAMGIDGQWHSEQGFVIDPWKVYIPRSFS
jgi:hypothetical protein